MNITATSIHMDYCVINFTTPGKSCSFIMADASHFASCSEDTERPNCYTCLITGLIPGVTYVFEIISQIDAARSNVTVQTGKTFYIPSWLEFDESEGSCQQKCPLNFFSVVCSDLWWFFIVLLVHIDSV